VCWEDTLKYKMLTSDRERMDCVRVILHRYIDLDSPVELNLPGQLTSYVAELRNLVDIYVEGSMIRPNMLDQLEEHCVVDIMDIFTRFKQSHYWHKISLELQKVKNQNEMLKQTGMT
jgi:hypothetical protein